MHATKQPHISAKLFRKWLLQYCWKGKKEKVSVNERMNAKYHSKSKTKINSDRRKNVKSDNQLLCHWRDTLRLLCLKAGGTLEPLSALLNSAELPLPSAHGSTPCQRLQGKVRYVWAAPVLPCLESHVLLPSSHITHSELFSPQSKNTFKVVVFFFSPNWDIILRIWPRSDPTMSLFPVLQLILRSSRKALKKSLTMQINV